MPALRRMRPHPHPGRRKASVEGGSGPQIVCSWPYPVEAADRRKRKRTTLGGDALALVAFRSHCQCVLCPSHSHFVALRLSGWCRDRVFVPCNRAIGIAMGRAPTSCLPPARPADGGLAVASPLAPSAVPQHRRPPARRASPPNPDVVAVHMRHFCRLLHATLRRV